MSWTWFFRASLAIWSPSSYQDSNSPFWEALFWGVLPVPFTTVIKPRQDINQHAMNAMCVCLGQIRVASSVHVLPPRRLINWLRRSQWSIHFFRQCFVACEIFSFFGIAWCHGHSTTAISQLCINRLVGFFFCCLFFWCLWFPCMTGFLQESWWTLD